MIDNTDSLTQPLSGIPERWLHLLRQAVRDDAKGCTGVALKIGRSRGYVSQFINGCNPLPASPNFKARVLSAFGDGRLDCPHLGHDIAPTQCHSYAARSYGAIEAADVPHWRACQGCLQNPANQPQPTGATA